MTRAERHEQVVEQIALLRGFTERLRDIPLRTAREELQRVESRLVTLRAERRALEPKPRA